MRRVIRVSGQINRPGKFGRYAIEGFQILSLIPEASSGENVRLFRGIDELGRVASIGNYSCGNTLATVELLNRTKNVLCGCCDLRCSAKTGGDTPAILSPDFFWWRLTFNGDPPGQHA